MDAVEALSEAARYGPFFTVHVAEPPEGALALAQLYAGDGLAGLIQQVDGKLGGVAPRVAASTFFLGWAAKLVSSALGCAQLTQVVPELDPAASYWTEDGVYCPKPAARTIPGEAAAADALTETLVDQHLRPMIKAITSEVKVAEPLLWGNAASALHGALRVLAYRRPAPFAEAILRAMLHDGPLAGTATFDPEFRRNSCCLYYRVPGGGLCGDCPLPSVPARD